MRDYRAYGLHVRSAVSLPFDPQPAPAAARPDVRVRLGAVARKLPDGPGKPVRTAFWQARPGAFLMEIGDVARFLVTGGRNVLVEPIGGDEDDIAAFFASSPFTALLQQRGVVTLHAAAVETAAGAALLLGTSGIGKSSLAAALVERGFPLIADDVTGVVRAADGQPIALPAFSRQRLWAHTLGEMRWRGRAQRPVRAGVAKYWLPAARSCAVPLPVYTALVLEAKDRPDGFGVDPLPPGGAFWLMWAHTHRKRALDALGQRPTHFGTVTALLRRVPVARVTRPRHPFLLDGLADRVASHLADAGAGRIDRARAAPAAAPAAAVDVPPAQGHASGRLAEPVAPRRACAPGIVWIAAWPKSGTTWLRAVLTSYLREDGGTPSINALMGQPANHREAFDEYLGLDSSDMTDEEVARYLPRFREVLAERLRANPLPHAPKRERNEPTFVKTHEAYRLPGGVARFPPAGCAGVVYLIRDPRDVAVSYAHHLNWPHDRTIALMADPQAHEMRISGGIYSRLPEPLTTWSGHVASWTEQTALRLHVARYEDLLAAPAAGFGAIARFAGLEWDAARLDRAIHHAAFHRLQAQEAESGYLEKQPTAPSFFRAGVAGSWRKALTATQVRALTSAHGEVMARFGYPGVRGGQGSSPEGSPAARSRDSRSR